MIVLSAKKPLTDKQKRIDLNDNGVVDGEDLKRLRAGEKPKTNAESRLCLAAQYKEMADDAGREPIRAAGALIIAADTLNVLTVLRSQQVDDGGVWCGVGGKIDGLETPEQAARREIKEEIGYEGLLHLTPALVFQNDWLTFHNFMGVVPNQFVAQLNYESDGYVWTDLTKIPKPRHFGLLALLSDANSYTKILAAIHTLPGRQNFG
jgi:8-oxo-dGTP pyrophosphatase MutT (NUDIX family)